jgi:deoxycytidylate deaminase
MPSIEITDPATIEYLLREAAQCSNHPAVKVGALALTKDGRCFMGANLEVPQENHSGFPSVHAEVVALMQSQGKVEKICVTHPPCKQCASHIFVFGVREVIVHPGPYGEHFLRRWAADTTEARKFLENMGVKYHIL